MLLMVRETGQSEALAANRHTVVGRPPGPPILNETDILERAAHHFRLRTRGDLWGLGWKLGTVTDFPAAPGAPADPI
jgi:hypothetical protein